jgi:hypothetical protein
MKLAIRAVIPVRANNLKDSHASGNDYLFYEGDYLEGHPFTTEASKLLDARMGRVVAFTGLSVQGDVISGYYWLGQKPRFIVDTRLALELRQWLLANP